MALDPADLDAAVLGFSALVVAGENYRRAAAAHYGLNVVETHAISCLHAYGPMTQTRLSGLLDLSGAAVTGLVDRLERTGTARRSVDPDDRRRHRVELTERAQEMLAETRDSLAHAFHQFPPSTVRALGAALPRLADGIQAEAQLLRELKP